MNDNQNCQASNAQIIDCGMLYDLLRRTLHEYADLLSSVEVEIFAVEMEKIPGSTDSVDPALWDEFCAVCDETSSIYEAIAGVARFVDQELVSLRRVDAAKRIVSDLRSALLISHSMPEPLRTFLAQHRHLDDDASNT